MLTAKPLSIQPIPYQGSKRALAPRICQLLPEGLQTLYEPFAGSAAITIYAATHKMAERFVIGDSFETLIDLWGLIIDEPTRLAESYSALWHGQLENAEHFNEVRSSYNEQPDPVKLLYLVARCVKNAVRFNRHGHFTQSADKRRKGMNPERVTRTVHAVSRLLKGRTTLFKGDFSECLSNAGCSDLVYLDPPYQGTTYGPDKRYAAQLDTDRLVNVLEALHASEVPYVLSYDGRTGEKTYGEPLPDTIGATHLEIEAGLSSQATLMGKKAVTVESLYVAHRLGVADMRKQPGSNHPDLFA